MSIKFYKYSNLALVQNKLNTDITTDDFIYSKDGNLILNKVIYKLVPEPNKDASNNYKGGQCLITKSDGTIEWGDVSVSVDDQLTETSTNPVSSKAIYKVITDNEKVVSAALNDLNTRVDNKVDKDGTKKLSTNDYTNSDKAIVKSHEVLYDYIHCTSVDEIPKNGTAYVDGKYLVDKNISGSHNSYYTIVSGGSIVNEVAVPEGTIYYLKNGEVWKAQSVAPWLAIRHYETLTFYTTSGETIIKKVLVND